MSPLLVTILTRPDGQIEVRLEADGALLVGVSAAPDGDLIDDLHGQVASGAAGAAAIDALAALLGEVLFSGDAGDGLRSGLDEAPDRAVLLAADPVHARWPWELARDPATGRQPVADGAGLVRVGGAPGSANATYAARGVLVVPSAHGQLRIDALGSATRHLGRKANLEVFPADPPTGPGLRRQLGGGATLVHVDANSRGGTVALDDGLVPVERLGLDGQTWLAVLGGTETTKDAALALRDAGVALVVGRQMELRPHETGAIDRELYRALAGGASLVDAIRRVRRALSRLAGHESGRWAAVTLWSAPPAPGEAAAHEAARPFPPPQRASGAFDLAAAGDALGEAGVATAAGAQGGTPMAAAHFVRQTIRMLRDADPAAIDAEISGRAAALRRLGAQLGDSTGAEHLSADQRVAHLADRFVDALGRSDLPLQAPPELDARLEAAARRAVVDARDLSRAAAGLLACPMIALRGAEGASASAAAQALGEAVFGYHVQVVDAAGTSPILTPGGQEGWLPTLARLAWRRDELDEAHPDQPAPSTRMPIVVRRPAGWSHHPGAWLAIEGAAALSADVTRIMDRALAAGALTGLSGDQSPWRLPLAADLRVLLLDPAAPPPGVPCFTLRPGAVAAEVDRALTHAERRLGPAEDPDAIQARRDLAQRLVAALRLLRVFVPVPAASVDAALGYALQRGADADAAIDDALQVFVGDALAAAPTSTRDALAAWLAGQPGTMLAALVRADASDVIDRERLTRLGLHLDAVAPHATPRISAPDTLFGVDAGRLVVRIGEWARLPGLAPPAPCPGLRARLR